MAAKVDRFTAHRPFERRRYPPTLKLDWLQPHDGNIVESLFRPRTFQAPLEAVAV
jgi:hypothetical protein